jgi:hypothetical protein
MDIDNSTINLKPSFNNPKYTQWKIISNGKRNVFNIDCSKIPNMDVLVINQSVMSIINSDLLGNTGISFMSSNITKVTSQQMLDTEYLLSIGFPTGVDTDVV